MATQWTFYLPVFLTIACLYHLIRLHRARLLHPIFITLYALHLGLLMLLCIHCTAANWRALLPYSALMLIVVITESIIHTWNSSSHINGISLREIFDQLPGNLYWKDLQGNYAGGNRQQRNCVSHLSTKAYLHKSDYDFFSETSADQIKIVDHRVIRENQYIILEENLTLSNGKRVVYLSHKAPIHDRKKRIKGLVGISIDITDMKREMTDELKTLHDIITMMPGSIYWMRHDGTYLGCNDNAARLMGFEDRKSIIGHHHSNLGLNSHHFGLMNERVITRGESSTHEERFKLKDGHEMTALSTKNPLRDSENRIVGMVGISIDITERKRMEETLRTTQAKLKKTNMMKSDFIANMSHDLRTPITCIIGMADNLTREPSHEKRQQYAQLLTQSCEELLKLLNDFIDVAAVEGSGDRVTYKRFHLRELFESCVRLAAPMAMDKKLEFLIEYDVDAPKCVIGDPHRIIKIINNLLSNAIKFTDTGSVCIRLQTSKRQGRQIALVLTIEDTGIGIPEDKQSIIFTRFNRLTPAYQGIYKGTGIGLSIVRQFVDDLGGDIDLHSQVGQGSTFICTLPVTEPMVADIENLSSPDHLERYCVGSHGNTDQSVISFSQPNKKNKMHQRSSKQSLRVLLAEDNHVAQVMASDKLKELGCQVDVAASSEAVVEQATANHYDMIFMDIGLPGNIDGCEATRRIRELDQKHDRYTPVIALTAHIEESYRQRCLDVGMNGILHKPLTSAMAREVLDAHLGKQDDQEA